MIELSPPDRSDGFRALGGSVSSSASRGSAFDLIFKTGIAAVVLGVIALAAYYGQGPSLFDFSSPGSVSTWAWRSLAVLFFARMAFLGYHALRYRAVPAPARDALPTLTVLIPAYNEGPMVRVSLLSALRNDYPADKLEILAVDDGSTDDTWAHIQSVAAAFPDRVTAIKQPRNMGKREALHTGFTRAKGEVVVTVDSDSRLAPDALKNIVAPFVKDPEIGAVAGRVMVLNRDANILTRLMAARFVITFELMRAAQSRFGAVFCCPGALSAYRTSAVREVLEDWSTQTFMGAPCTIGEDRALTTWLLKRGYRAEYQGTADVHTLMPTHFKGMSKMLVRWERGNIREDLAIAPALFTKWRTRDRWVPTFEIFYELVQYPLGYLGLGLLVANLAHHPMGVLKFLASFFVLATLESLYCLKSERGSDLLYGVAYATLSLVGLQWVFPYSAITLRDGRWMTR